MYSHCLHPILRQNNSFEPEDDVRKLSEEKTAALRPDMRLVLKGHRERAILLVSNDKHIRFCCCLHWAVPVSKSCTKRVFDFVWHPECWWVTIRDRLVWPPSSSSCRPPETQSAALSVTYIVVLTSRKWLLHISGKPDETVYHISLLFRCISRQGHCDLLFMLWMAIL